MNVIYFCICNEATFIWDNVPCHKKQSVLEAAASKNVKLLFVSPRMTNLLQSADVSWFKPLKSKFNNFWSDWFLNGEHSMTENNNLRSPCYENVINLISQIWINKLVHEDIILNEVLE